MLSNSGVMRKALEAVFFAYSAVLSTCCLCGAEFLEYVPSEVKLGEIEACDVRCEDCLRNEAASGDVVLFI